MNDSLDPRALLALKKEILSSLHCALPGVFPYFSVIILPAPFVSESADIRRTRPDPCGHPTISRRKRKPAPRHTKKGGCQPHFCAGIRYSAGWTMNTERQVISSFSPG